MPDETPAPNFTRNPEFCQAYYRNLKGLRKSFAIPGHKGNTGLIGDVVGGDRPIDLSQRMDIPSLGLLRVAEEAAAHQWGADYCRFSVNGSSAANQAAICAVVGPHDKVIISRASHKSALFGLIYSGAVPIWLPAEIDASGQPCGVSVSAMKKAIRENPDAKAAFVGSPSYLGIMSDIRALSGECHEADIPLIVDAAWAGHFGFHPVLPPSPISEGADLVIISAHKTLPSLTQGALLLANGERLDVKRLMKAFDSTQTTSPSAAIVASIDASRFFLAQEGPLLYGPLIDSVASARKMLSAIPGVSVLQGPEVDPLKLVIDMSGSTISGLSVEAYLNTNGLEVESADVSTVIAQVTIADTPEEIEEFVKLVTEVVDGASDINKSKQSVSLWSYEPVVRMRPRDAFFAPSRKVSRVEAIGQVSAELIAPYPPGVPVIAPGEEVTHEALRILEDAIENRTHIAYADDPKLRTIMIVD